MIRCRRNALLHCPYELPVLSPFDNIVRAQPGHLADFNFVELSRRGKYSALTLIPYVGPMWYHRCSVEHMLHYGIASWDDIKWQLSASGRLPHDILVEPLLEIERAWGRTRISHSPNIASITWSGCGLASGLISTQ